MNKFLFAISHAADWTNAAKELGIQLTNRPQLDGGRPLGWLYATDIHAGKLDNMVAYLRQVTCVDDWVGSVGMGVCWHNGSNNFGETFGRPAAVAMIADHKEESFSILPSLCESISEITEESRVWMDQKTPPFGVVHGDPMNDALPGLIEALSMTMGNVTLETSGFLVGGLTSSGGVHRQIAGDVVSGGLSGIMFAQDIEVATGLTQGYAPLGPVHRVTDSMENVIMTLNNEPALSVLKLDVGELLARDINQIAGYIHVALPVVGSDTGDYVVRNLMGIDPERGWLAIGGLIETRDQLIFVRRDPLGAEDDLVRMIDDVVNRLPGPARGGLYFSCVARGPNLFGKEGREMEIISEITKDIPLVGFFGQGEISNNRLYGYTGVLVLFL